MLFRKKMPRRCGECIHATVIDDSTVRCSKKGNRSMDDKCLLFSYDPCKRIPLKPKALDFMKYDQEDYSL